MNVSLIGTVESIGAVKQVSDRFRKREVVLKGFNEGSYYTAQLINDMCERIEDMGIKEGFKLTMECVLEGRKWTNKDGEDKIFMNLNAKEILITGRPDSGSGGSIKAKDIDVSNVIPDIKDMPEQDMDDYAEDDLPF